MTPPRAVLPVSSALDPSASLEQIRRDIGRVRAALHDRNRADAERALYDLECEVERALDGFRRHVLMVTDVNLQSVQYLARQQDIIDELKQHNQALVAQAKQLAEARARFETLCNSMAAANVEAVLAADLSAEKLAEAERDRKRLASERQDLLERIGEMESQSVALASANVEAVMLMDENEMALVTLRDDAERLRVVQAQLKEQVVQDALTGLFNHRYLRERLEHEMARTVCSRNPLAVLFADLDHFKGVNDTHGHPFGDQVLRAVGEAIAQTVRRGDVKVRIGETRPGDAFAARYGGEEFVVILPGTNVEGANVVAERLRAKIESLCFTGPNGDEVKITVSVGVAVLAEADTEPLEVIHRADEAMYRAKRAGRNRVET